MKIGIVLHPYGEQEPAGLGRATFELTKTLIAAAPEHQFLIFLKGKPRHLPEFPGENWSVHPLGGGVFWLDRLRSAPPADVYIFNTPVMPVFWRPRKSVVIALDFAYLRSAPHGMKEYGMRFFLRRRHRVALQRADRVAAISEATRLDAIGLFGVAPEKVKTIHLGFNRICLTPEETVPAPERFFLFVGVLKERKNVLNIIRGFAEFCRHRPDWHLIIVGKREGEYAQKLWEAVLAEKIESAVHFFGYRRDGELSYLYRRAAALIYPSIIEGFGFPILEAMDCGTPVITSRTSSLPELAGDAAILVDPQRPQEIARAMERIVSDHALRSDLIAKGRGRAIRFSWKKTAEEFLQIICSV